MKKTMYAVLGSFVVLTYLSTSAIASPIRDAIQAGDLEQVRKVIEEGSIGCQEQYESPFDMAVRLQQVKIVRELILKDYLDSVYKEGYKLQITKDQSIAAIKTLSEELGVKTFLGLWLSFPDGLSSSDDDDGEYAPIPSCTAGEATAFVYENELLEEAGLVPPL